MKNLTNILAQEQMNKHYIYFYKYGNQWQVYNRSAYYLSCLFEISKVKFIDNYLFISIDKPCELWNKAKTKIIVKIKVYYDEYCVIDCERN
ncbi:MAG: hypothetical protein RR220_08070, partial [Bacteroidaceae bacterium]